MTIINLKRYARSLLLSTTNMFLPYTSASILYKIKATCISKSLLFEF